LLQDALVPLCSAASLQHLHPLLLLHHPVRAQENRQKEEGRLSAEKTHFLSLYANFPPFHFLLCRHSLFTSLYKLSAV
jgi:hypothetical protein